MADVWPKHSLAESDPWARRVSESAKNNERDIASLRTQSVAQNQATAASLDALRQQIAESIVPVTTQSTATNFAIGTGPTELNRSVVPVPSGYTRALVTCTATVTGYNSNSGVIARIFVSADINGVSASPSSQSVGSLLWGGTTSTYSAVLTNISGEIYTRSIASVPVVGFAADPGSVSNLSTMVLFLR